jgi:hypothetical protein
MSDHPNLSDRPDRKSGLSHFSASVYHPGIRNAIQHATICGMIFDRIWKSCVLILLAAILALSWRTSIQQRRDLSDIDQHLTEHLIKIEEQMPDADDMKTSMDSIEVSVDDLAHGKRR